MCIYIYMCVCICASTLPLNAKEMNHPCYLTSEPKPCSSQAGTSLNGSLPAHRDVAVAWQNMQRDTVDGGPIWRARIEVG